MDSIGGHIMQEDEFGTARIVLIGGVDINVSDIYSLVKSSRPSELILVGQRSEVVAGKVRSILAGSVRSEFCKVFCGDFSDAANADLVILSTSVEECEGELADEHLRRTVEAVRSDVRSVVDSGFDGILFVTTNPIDVMSYVAMEESRFPAERVIGLGTSIDEDARSQLPLSGVNTWCSGMHFNSAFLDHCDPTCAHFESVVQKARSVHLSEFSYAGNRTSGMATCVARICKAIVNDEREIFPVSTFLRGEYKETDLFLTVPCVVGRNGVERIVSLPINEAEKVRIHKYAEELRGLLRDLGLMKRTAVQAL